MWTDVKNGPKMYIRFLDWAPPVFELLCATSTKQLNSNMSQLQSVPNSFSTSFALGRIEEITQVRVCEKMAKWFRYRYLHSEFGIFHPALILEVLRFRCSRPIIIALSTLSKLERSELHTKKYPVNVQLMHTGQ